MQAVTKARFLFVIGVLVLLAGLLPILRSRGVALLSNIPTEGIVYNLIVVVLGAIAILISLGRESFRY